jgi:hypothetical protein
MKCEAMHDSDQDEEDHEESDEEIKQLEKEIEKKKMARKRRSQQEESCFSDTTSSSIKSTGNSVFFGSPQSSVSLSTFMVLYWVVGLGCVLLLTETKTTI